MNSTEVRLSETVAKMYEESQKAHQRIKDKVVRTPSERSIYLSGDGCDVFLKLECFQHTRSFKYRGALNKMLSLSMEDRVRGVAAISSGNHGAAVSSCGNLLGIENVMIMVPSCTPKSKIDKIEYYGSRAMVIGDNYDECHDKGMRYLRDKGMTYVDAYDKDPIVYAGQGTVGIEMVEDIKGLDTVLVPIGGGGLITGIAAVVKSMNPEIKIVGLQTEACPAMLMSMKDGVHYSKYPTDESVCEALVGGVGELAYKLSDELIDEIVIVKEEYIKKGISHMLKKEKIVAEPSSCIGIGALIQHEILRKGTIGIVVSGGNISVDMMKKYITDEAEK